MRLVRERVSWYGDEGGVGERARGEGGRKEGRRLKGMCGCSFSGRSVVKGVCEESV